MSSYYIFLHNNHHDISTSVSQCDGNSIHHPSMSRQPPVPSKGALRALRRLALGTSCTVAFSAGMITEDRRRRIHSAREVHENALRIKTSRNYHSAGAIVGATFDEQVKSYGDVAGWRSREGWDGGDAVTGDISETSHQRPSRPKHDITFVGRSLSRYDGVFGRSDQAIEDATSKLSNKRRHNRNDLASEESNTTHRSEVAARKSSPRTTYKDMHIKHSKPPTFQIRQSDPNKIATVARDATSTAKHATEGLTANAKKSVHMELICDSPNAKPAGKATVTECIELYESCRANQDLNLYVPVLESILEQGPYEEGVTRSLGVDTVAEHLLQCSGYDKVTGTQDVDLLKRAVAIYTTKHIKKSTSMDSNYHDLGKRLLPATFRATLYRTTTDLFWYLDRRRADRTLFGVDFLVLAEHARAEHRDAVKHYLKMFTTTCPSQDTFYKVTSSALTSALDIGDLEQAENLAAVASAMASRLGLATSTTWVLELLNTKWKHSRSFLESCELFQRLEKYVDQTSHPQALYSTMTKIALDAGREDFAMEQARCIEEKYGMLDIITRGHFALVQAKKDDWEGVERTFTDMRFLVDESSMPSFLRAFLPVLKHFSLSHNVGETERFLFKYIESHGICPNQDLSLLMVEIYAECRDLDAISRWIEFVRPRGSLIDAHSFNRILSSLHKKWHVPYSNLYELCRKVTSFSVGMVDQATLSVLRGSMSSKQRNDPARAEEAFCDIDKLLEAPRHSRGRDLHRAMSDALGKGRPQECLRLYHEVRTLGKLITPQCLAMAVEACIRGSGGDGLPRAMNIMRDAKILGTDVTPAMTPLLFFQIREAGKNAQEIQRVVNTTLFALKQRHMDFPLTAASKVASILVDRGLYRSAVEMWSALWSSHSHRSSRMDLVSLTVLLQAYIGLNDADGLKWVINTISQNSIIPDNKFKSRIRNARKEARKEYERDVYNTYNAQRFEMFNDVYESVKNLRSNLPAVRDTAERKTLLIMELAALDDSRKTHVEVAASGPETVRTPQNVSKTVVDGDGAMEISSRMDERLERVELNNTYGVAAAG